MAWPRPFTSNPCPAVLLEEISSSQTPEGLAARLSQERGLVLLRTGLFGFPQARYSFVTARPFLSFRSRGCQGELDFGQGPRPQSGNPWRMLESLLARYELQEELGLPLPLGGCFGYWGYDLKNFVEPRLPRHAFNDLELPDCAVGFYDSLVAFDHLLGKIWVLSTGLQADGSRSSARSRAQRDFWQRLLEEPAPPAPQAPAPVQLSARPLRCNLSRDQFVERVGRSLRYIRSGDIYQVNLSQRFELPWEQSGWELYKRLSRSSPAPFSAFIQNGSFQLVSSSPEEFLHLSGRHIRTRPIKGTRPRASERERDLQLAHELQTSPKENAELLMITDLLRNDLGRICEFGSVRVPALAQLEAYPQVQHLVSTVEGKLRPEVTHLSALASCFPGGSITGAPKYRAMEIIDELEPTARGPYTGALGYLGFNRESELSIIIRTALCREQTVWFQTGAGIVADSDPQAEYQETLDKGRGFFQALALAKELEPLPASAATSSVESSS